MKSLYRWMLDNPELTWMAMMLPLLFIFIFFVELKDYIHRDNPTYREMRLKEANEKWAK